MIVVLDLGQLNGVRDSSGSLCFAHCKVPFSYFILNSKQFCEAHRVSIISPILQIKKGGSEWLKEAIQLAGVCLQSLSHCFPR